MDRIRVYYRLSDAPAAAKKKKPSFVNNRNSLINFFRNFNFFSCHVIADSVSEETQLLLKELEQNFTFTYEHVSYKSGSRSFIHAFELAIKNDEDDIIYFIEDDFIHMKNSASIVLEGFYQAHADYVSLYDHPDKYTEGENPYVEDGGEFCQVLCTESSHWKTTGSTVMSFAAFVRTLKEDEYYWRKCAEGHNTKSFRTFSELVKNKKTLSNMFRKKRKIVNPIPAYATHGETRFLSPFRDWKEIMKNSINT